MNTIKQFMTIAMIFCIFSITVYAEAKDFSYKITFDDEVFSIVEDNVISNTDNSELYVDVVKEKNGNRTKIYSGPLGDYADGAFANEDFSKSNIMIVLDWNTLGEEAIYIIPTNSANTISKLPSNTFKALSTSKSEFFRLEDALTIEDMSGILTKKIYDVSILPNDYSDYMSKLGSETTNYSDDSTPATAITYDYEITAINIRDDEDNSADYLVNGGVLQSVTIESNGVDDNVILAVAEYNGYRHTPL